MSGVCYRYFRDGPQLCRTNNIVHYSAPSSIEDYFQESGHAGRSGDQAKSVIFWKPRDAPMKQDLSNPRNAEVAAVRRYLDNNNDCRRCQLLRYFDPSLPSQLSARDHLLCCDVCASTVTSADCTQCLSTQFTESLTCHRGSNQHSVRSLSTCHRGGNQHSVRSLHMPQRWQPI